MMALLNDPNARKDDQSAPGSSERLAPAELRMPEAASESEVLFAAASTPSTQEDGAPGASRVQAPEEPPIRAFASFSATACIGGAAAAGWLLAALWLGLWHFGLESLVALAGPVQAALAAVAVGPPIVIWLAATAVAEASHARKLAEEFARTLPDAVLPFQRPDEAVKRVTSQVRREIAELQGAVDGVYARLTALRSDAAQHALLFEETIGDALNGSKTLTQKLVNLTDAARQSTETAVHAANVAASAVRESQQALGDARAGAELIRRETQAMHTAASAAFVAMHETAQVARSRARQGDKRLASEPDRSAPGWTLHAAAASIAQGQVDRIRMSRLAHWSHALPKPANDSACASAANELVNFPPPRNDAVVRRALDLIATSGVSVGETLSERDLDAASAAARKGAPIRRRVVLDAAPVEVARIARLLRRDAEAKETALAFRKRSDLAQPRNPKRRGAADLMRAYLLVDAALG